MKDRVRSGRPRNVRTRELKAKIKKIIVRSARRSMRKMSRDFGISSRSIGRVVHDDQGGAPAHTANTNINRVLIIKIYDLMNIIIGNYLPTTFAGRCHQ